VTQRDPEQRDDGWSVDEREQRLAQARLAFDRGIREASVQGARAARRLLVPALWGAALVGTGLLALALVRALRRPSERALLRISIEPRLQAKPLLPTLGGAVARFAVQRLLAVAAPAGELQSTNTFPGAAATSRSGKSNGRAQA
jgi:hypothetical protein